MSPTPSRASKPVFSVVVPVYGNEDTLTEVIDRLNRLPGFAAGELEAVFVVDASPDNSLAVLRRSLPGSGLSAQVLTHSRNFGSFAAIRSGMAAARGRYVAVMAADLQERPELMSEFYAALSSGEVDVVVGRREARADPAMASLAARSFWAVYRMAVNPELPPGGVDVFACTAAVAQTLVGLRESHTSLVGLLYWVGYRRVEVGYRRQERTTGKSGWTLRKRWQYLMDSVFAFTDLPVRLLTAVGGLGTLVTVVVGLVVFVAWLTGGITEPGYTPLMLVIVCSTFLLLTGLGIVGAYVWRAYENSKLRPSAIVASRERFGE